ncbi:hypothetical protein J3A83DRAFT_4190800 [Scleroderma citrinum]
MFGPWQLFEHSVRTAKVDTYSITYHLQCTSLGHQNFLQLNCPKQEMNIITSKKVETVVDLTGQQDLELGSMEGHATQTTSTDMARQKSSLNKNPLIPESPSKRKMPTSENSLLEAVHHIKKVGKQAHLQAEKTQKAYEGHIHQRYKALALYLSWRGFHENQSQNTVEGVDVAFKKLWDSAILQHPAMLVSTSTWWLNHTNNVMASIKHKVTMERSDCMHSSAMKKEYMDKILTWLITTCLELETWIIWTRCFELVKLKQEDIQIMDVTLVNHVLTKYLRGKQGNHYKIYLRPDLTSCDLFFWLMVWVRQVEHIHLGQAMVDGNFIFPAISANSVLKPLVQWWGGWADGEHHDTLIHYLLDELHSYENDHSNALGPFPCEADMSLAATREELWMFQMSTFTTHSSAPPAILALRTNHLSLHYTFPQPSATSLSLVTAEDGIITLRSQAWKDIIQHWEEGVLEKRLLSLKDWPYEYTHGPNCNLQSKYNQWHIIALEFLNLYKGDEKKFIEAYESNIQKRITSLLHAITATHQQQDEAEI